CITSSLIIFFIFSFYFQEEDGIRDFHVTGVQTCALPIYPRNDLSYSETFLHMMFGTPCEESKISPTLAKAMDRIFILHADHEQRSEERRVGRECRWWWKS